MFAQDIRPTHNVACLLLVAISLFAVGGCLWPMTSNYQGWTSRPVIVTVTDDNTGQVVYGAAVRLVPDDDDDMQRFLANTASDKKKYEEVTSHSGRAELLIWFPCGGEQTHWLIFSSDKGKFGLEGVGTLQVDAEGYKPFECEFVLLTGKDSRSVNDKSPVEVSVKLIPSD